MGIVQLVLVHLHAQRLSQAIQGRLLSGAHRHGIELCGGAQDVQQAFALGAFVHATREGLDGGVADVVIGCDKTQIRGSQIHIVLDAAATKSLQAFHSVLHHLTQVIAQVLMSHPLQTIVVGILGEPAIVESPSQPVHRILLVVDRLHDDLGIHVIGHALVQMALYGKRLVDELLVVLFLGILREQDYHARLVDAWSAGSAHHLQHVVDGVVNVSILTAIELLGVHDDHEMCQHCHAPAQLLCGH
mmetsp:Transcript_89753/g.214516  ORF Transcript_89753/g.214516 Transcript_89753/m.214516 type:complete len:245 (-) Transcript_89753:5106-5840(-)